MTARRAESAGHSGVGPTDLALDHVAHEGAYWVRWSARTMTRPPGPLPRGPNQDLIAN